MSERLRRDQVAVHFSRLRAVLTNVQASRLDAIVEILAADCRFLLRDALVAGDFPENDARAQDAFQDFRKKINAIAAKAHVNLSLELDSHKTPPDSRHGWFIGSDPVDEGISEFTESAAGHAVVENAMRQAVAEMGKSRRTRVYVSYSIDDSMLKVDTLLDRLRSDLAADAVRSWEVTYAGSVNIGESVEEIRDRLCEQADVRVALVTTNYLAEHKERRRVFNSSGPVVAFALSLDPWIGGRLLGGSGR